MGKLSVTENKLLMAQARDALQGKWGLVAGTTALFILISAIVQCIPFVGGIISLAISGPVALGFAIFYLSIIRDKGANSSQVFDGFNRFGVSLGAYLLVLLFYFLWSLLLIIPGIIAGISYSMTFYIIADDNNIGPMEAITKSKTIMQGNKWKFLCLNARFCGWFLLSVCTLGIGFIWLFPYIATTNAKFYEEITSVDISELPFAADLQAVN